ncbi:hypothetical protein GCM10010156_49300 [Planobispora rosea]|uniref:Uncharacterized protein n=1 Tax=Planobispora rosea TaxID=35762 RepID=A0A8J3S0S1_PLARO|nr:hypothetical protein [Planobispora rosea]GGS84816.1 hypothetical protein GCM10010156_49300 [Planobispora rosea]GIH86441.1 hypothetical protein Pro02_48490 [Planobispora rosea]
MIGKGIASAAPTFTVSIWHNTCPLALMRGWHPRDPMQRVFSYPIPAEQARDPHAVLEEAFEAFNVGEGELAAAYRALGNRSLSVGDIVVIGEVAFACAPIGWERPRGSITIAALSAQP